MDQTRGPSHASTSTQVLTKEKKSAKITALAVPSTSSQKVSTTEKGCQTELGCVIPVEQDVHKCRQCNISYEDIAMFHIHKGCHLWNAPLE